ncbi:hypothetical protein GCM10023238_15700 [Streptomyces heliomycini]
MPKGLGVVDMALAQESAGLVMLYHSTDTIDAKPGTRSSTGRLLDSLPTRSSPGSTTTARRLRAGARC